jgi:hypothetical protein
MGLGLCRLAPVGVRKIDTCQGPPLSGSRRGGNCSRWREEDNLVSKKGEVRRRWPRTFVWQSGVQGE